MGWMRPTRWTRTVSKSLALIVNDQAFAEEALEWKAYGGCSHMRRLQDVVLANYGGTSRRLLRKAAENITASLEEFEGRVVTKFGVDQSWKLLEDETHT